MKHIKEFLPNLQNISHKNHLWKIDLMQQWEQIVGTLCTKVSIYKIYNDSMILGVSDSSWMQELYLLSDLLKKKINQSIDEPRITTIRFKLIREIKKATSVTQESTPLICTPLKISKKEQQALDKIKDPELSKALTRLLEKCHLSS